MWSSWSSRPVEHIHILFVMEPETCRSEASVPECDCDAPPNNRVKLTARWLPAGMAAARRSLRGCWADLLTEARGIMTTAAGGDAPVRFPISFDPWYRVLSSILGLPPSNAYVQVAGEQIEVRMGWAFRSRFPRSAVASTSAPDMRPISRGVHGFGGRWLVNGSGQGILSIQLCPAQRAYLMGVPVRLQELLVSITELPALASSLRV
jgi:hypothetical protein